MNFTDYLKALKPSNDSAGDFVRLATGQVELPETKSWRRIVRFMQERGAPPSVIWAGERLWLNYLKANAKAERKLRDNPDR